MKRFITAVDDDVVTRLLLTNSWLDAFKHVDCMSIKEFLQSKLNNDRVEVWS